MKIFVNAGHWDNINTEHIEDPGARVGEHKEGPLVMHIRNRIAQLMPNIYFVPDALNLRKSIDFVNEHASPNDLAVSIHLNSNNNIEIRGVEAYYSNDATIARYFSELVSKALEIPNRGARHDSETYVGSLGWLRKLNCRSVLIEACYLTNWHDRKLINTPEGIDQAARGIIDGIKRYQASQSKSKDIDLQIKRLWAQILVLLQTIANLRSSL